jgi:hypothetical protein
MFTPCSERFEARYENTRWSPRSLRALDGYLHQVLPLEGVRLAHVVHHLVSQLLVGDDGDGWAPGSPA